MTEPVSSDPRAHVALNLRRAAGAVITLHESGPRALTRTIERQAAVLERVGAGVIGAAKDAFHAAARVPTGAAIGAVRLAASWTSVFVRPASAALIRLSCRVAGTPVPEDPYREAMNVSTFGAEPGAIPTPEPAPPKPARHR